MPGPNEKKAVRAAARAFEEGLPKEQRKKLGQYFTGVPLGKLLAHLALAADTRTVLDPMAGHGDLLDATAEAATERRVTLDRLDGIEIDAQTAEFCRDRLNRIGATTSHEIIDGSAFDPRIVARLPVSGYDLVITNPPYVRYQTQNGNAAQGATSRSGLLNLIDKNLLGAEKEIWHALVKGYSGLADLSIPAWILAAFLVRPEGRLALVVPATWRSRDYGDVIRYLLLRCFELEYIVEDTQPGWFSDALVRTHLIVARRLPAKDLEMSLAARAAWRAARSLLVSPEAGSKDSLVAGAFAEPYPELAFAAWVSAGAKKERRGILTRKFDLEKERSSLAGRAARRSWYQKLEVTNDSALPLFSALPKAHVVDIPEPLRQLVGHELSNSQVTTLDEIGIEVGQGLRTGCNSFFYVDVCGEAPQGIKVRASRTYGNREFVAPAGALRPVLRRQSELAALRKGDLPSGRVLDLRHWVLPEDLLTVDGAAATYRMCGESLPSRMPDELADFVRTAATLNVEDRLGGKSAAELSAVRTNVRAHRPGAAAPRFWYMLPHFTARHLPIAFVPRIVQAAPWVELNFDPPILIDANFSTFWTTDKTWSPVAVKSVLNSIWCQFFMEAIGTPMGGGALKLEASHVRQMLIPRLSLGARRQLELDGVDLIETNVEARRKIDRIVLMALFGDRAKDDLRHLADAMVERAQALRRVRLRIAA